MYLKYDGVLSDLSEVDRFCHKMVRIPGYQDRLQSMLFKATFDEKCAEVEKVSTVRSKLIHLHVFV